MTVIKEKAYAKINLYLDVLGIRDDGFHEIKTVMHTVSLADDIMISVAPSKLLTIRLFVDGNHFLPTDSKNLVYRAAEMFFEKLGVCADVRIRLTKRIPVAAGLAGGSSDAAATLRGLNKIYKRPFATKAILNMASALGSDVPYCVVGKTALCEGRGEIMRRLDCNFGMNVLIANSGEHVSTPEAYTALDKEYSNFDGSIASDGEKAFSKLIGMLSSGVFDKNALYNIFEAPILSKRTRSAILKEKLVLLGADGVLMSGSGPSLFAIFKDKNSMENAKNKLTEEGFSAWCAESVL